jgi:hypothetical protein
MEELGEKATAKFFCLLSARQCGKLVDKCRNAAESILMITLLHNGKLYLSQSIAWVSFEEPPEASIPTLSIGFSDQTVMEQSGGLATSTLETMERELGVRLR